MCMMTNRIELPRLFWQKRVKDTSFVEKEWTSTNFKHLKVRVTLAS